MKKCSFNARQKGRGSNEIYIHNVFGCFIQTFNFDELWHTSISWSSGSDLIRLFNRNRRHTSHVKIDTSVIAKNIFLRIVEHML